MAAPKPLLTKVQRYNLGTLLASHRNAEGVADYEGSPTSQAVLKYVSRLIQAERRYHEKKRGLR